MRVWSRVAVMAIVALVAGMGSSRAQQATPPAPSAAPAADSGNLKVTVEYKGAGTVSADNRIWVWLFDTPNISAQSVPIATGMLKENKGTYTFVGLPKEIYIAVAFDNVGGYDGTTAPPPYGTPISIFGAAADGTQAKAVTTGGSDAAVTVAFDDSVKMQ